MGEKPDDIDPSLLNEVGRASAIQDLAAEARRIGDEGKAIKETTIAELSKNNQLLKTQKRILVFTIVVLLSLQIWSTYRSTFITGPDLRSVKVTVQGPLSEANKKLDDVCSFIDEVVKRSEGRIQSTCDE